MIRASRVYSALSKAPLRAGDWALRGVGSTIRKHPMGSLAAVGGVGASASEMSQGVQKGVSGVSPDYLRLQRLGLTRQPDPSYPFSYSSFGA